MKKYILLLFSFFSITAVFSQKGKNGAGNIVAGTVVNAYTSLTADAFTGNTTLSVASAAGYGIGDLVYIIQMQGASVNCHINIFGNPNSAEPLNPFFGKITNYNNAGNNEYAQVSSVAGNVITIDCPLKNNYTAAGKVQIVKVPRYTSLNISATGTITCPLWNGTTGGVIAIEVDGNTTINAGGSIDASGMGFRGGTLSTGSFFGAAAWCHNNPQEGARKGESIAGDVTTYLANFNGQYCRGAVANGGGGANSNNAGGGGGANAGDTSLYTGFGNPDISVAGYVTAWNLESSGFAATSSSGGGRGGYTFSNSNISPITNGPGLAAWAGDNRRAVGGMGGRPLNYNTGRIFCGGGAGAGDQNDGYGGAGGDGGGIINIISYGTVSGTGQILANGENGFNSNASSAAPFNNCNGRDGAGGGGGGGAIVINSIGLINSLTVSARGGNGGSQQMKSGFLTTTAMAYGPGAGGGGGYIGTTASAITAFVNGGPNGIVQYLSGNETCQIDNLFPANGATSGGSGTINSTLLVVPTITASPDVTICVNNAATVTATLTGAPGPINWYSALAGPTLLGTGSPFTTTVFTTPGTYTVWAGFCPDGIYRDPVVITVTNGPTLIPLSATICAGQTGTISVSGATTYTWSTGATSATATAAPLSTTVYTVTGTIGTCTTATTATITVNSASIGVNSSTICTGQSATLTAGAATSYTWSTGANTQTVGVSPATTTNYTINATVVGGCVVTNTTTVTVNTSPTLSAVNATICSGNTGTISVSGATNYTWSIGSNSSSITASPLTTTSFSVVGANGSCTASANATITVNPNPTITVLSTTICAGQTGTITAAGAASYTWTSGPTTNTFSAAPAATTVYTINGTSGTCTSSATGTITVNTAAPIAVNSATICSGQSVLLTAGAATSYTWSTGANTQTVSVNPSTTTVYTINATMPGGCVASNTSTVTVNSTPTLSVVNATVCPGQTGTVSVSGATNYTWSTGSNSSSITATPATTTTFTVVGANGTCTTSGTATISVGAVGSIVVNSPTICIGQSATLTAGSAISYTWSTGANTQTVSVNPVTTTIYTLSAITAGGCNVIGSSTVIVNSNPVLAVNNATICVGQTGTISASGATTYTWNTGATTPTITANPIVNTTYTVTGANGTCTSSATASITINTSGTISVNSPTICAGQTATLIAGAAATYTWNTGGSTQTILVNPITTTPYTITATLAGGCIVSNTTTVTVNPTPTITANTVSICSGLSATLTAAGATTYLWNDGNTTATNILSPTITTVYTVTGTTGGCSSNVTTTVFVTPTPTLSVASITVCAGQVATLTANGATSYTWDPTPGPNVVSPSYTVTPLTTTAYTVIGATNNCTAMATASVVIGPNLSITVNTPTICAGQTATLIATSTATNYLWSNAAVTQTIFVSPIANTSYTVTGSKGTCTGSTVANVIVNSLPVVSVNSTPVCAGGSSTITATGATTYSWSTGSNNTPSISVSPVANTNYTVIAGAGSCTISSVYNLTISPTPTIVTANTNICNGGTATLTASGAANYTWLPSGSPGNSITVSPSVNTTYTVIGDNGSCSSQAIANVTVLNGLIAPTNNATMCQGQTAAVGTTLSGTSYLWSNGGTTQTIIVSPATTTTYSLLVVAGSCSYTGNSTVTVIPTPTLQLNNASICLGETATLSASGATNGYTWNPGNLSGNTVTVSPTVTTNYVVTSANGLCPATATTQVIVNTKPNLVFSPGDLLICPGTSVTYNASGANIYEWYVNGVYHFGNPLTISPTQNSTITLIGSNGGCSTTSVISLSVSDVKASFNPESNYVDYPGYLTFTNTSVGATEINWDFGNGQTSTNNIATAMYEFPGKYLTALVAKNEMGCMDTTYFVIEAGCGKGDFYMPNTFTPNNDGLNEEYKVLGGSCVTQFNGSVFDRWGNEIFKWKEITDTWDGSFKGKEVEEGVYNYLISYTLYNGKVFSKTGHIAIIR
ncbi:MAG: gliding motility-associated C-terminal domain-containing protein [Bacteroidetes bacterium]|nr:gliding motility-associated C-terminal domain-containing protein [Bacteroidota bacterium]